MRLRDNAVLYAMLTLAPGCAPVAAENQTFLDAARPSVSGSQTQSGLATSDGSMDGNLAASALKVRQPAARRAAQPRPAPFVAQVKTPIVVLGLLSAGRLEIVDQCLTVILKLGGDRGTAVLPKGAKIERAGGEIIAVKLASGRRIPLNKDAGIPGGGATVEAGNLVAPIPARCPRVPFVIGG